MESISITVEDDPIVVNIYTLAREWTVGNNVTPSNIINFINEHIDHDKIYDQALTIKLQMFYDCLDWGKPVDEEQSIERFF